MCRGVWQSVMDLCVLVCVIDLVLAGVLIWCGCKSCVSCCRGSVSGVPVPIPG